MGRVYFIYCIPKELPDIQSIYKWERERERKFLYQNKQICLHLSNSPSNTVFMQIYKSKKDSIELKKKLKILKLK